MPSDIRVAILDTFWEAYAALPKVQQKRTREFLPKFRAEPTSPSHNYEKINGANPDYRSVRIDGTYRGIVLKPKQGNTYVLLWVDHHDDAYAWAARKQVEINPRTGTLQLYETLGVSTGDDAADGTVASPAASAPPTASVAPAGTTSSAGSDAHAGAEVETGGHASREPSITAPAPDAPAEPLFNLDETRLLGIGVPSTMVGEVAALMDEAALEAIKPRLPLESWEALTLFAGGIDWADVWEEYGPSSDAPIDTDDIDAALERDASKRRFHVIASDEDLESILAAPLEKWRVYLHPSQRKLVERDWSGPVRVTGGAGTGKTVVAMHRAAWLARRRTAREHDAVVEPRVLFLTYNTNLAADITANLQRLVTPEVMARIEVVNIDAWVNRFLKKQRYAGQIRFEGDLEPLWNDVLDTAVPDLEKPLPRTFYLEEWERIVLPNRIVKREEYLRVPRTGRGVALNRRQRATIWEVFDEMRAALAKRGWRTWQDAMLDARDEVSRLREPLGYHHVVVDETQDMGPEALQLIRALVPEGMNDLFFVGDGHQRIYRRRAVMGRCGIRIVGRSRKLKINYRTTEEIRRFASALLDGLAIDDLDGGDDTGPGYRSLTRGPVPELRGFDDERAEIDGIIAAVREIERDGGALGDCCVMLRTVDLRDRYHEALRAAGLETVSLDRRADQRGVPGVRVGNMHRVKGLEFRHVVIAAMRHGVVPNKQAVDDSDDRTELAERELAERALVHVCASRAIESLILTWHGMPSRYLAGNADD